MSFSINDYNFIVPDSWSNYSLIQACSIKKVSIPRFCYYSKLSIAGNCRMCLIEENATPKLIASCAMPLANDMSLYTNTIKVKKAREAVLEFLLINHPLDCPICDQGGECDLQDQSLIFGGDRGRFYEHKRSVENKNCGPLVKTIMNRCIHRTRCVRFATEIAGISELGVTGRGNSMQIGFYIERLLNSEVSGNVIDLCPVGALTSKPYSFTARPWELKSFFAFDLSDSLCSEIRVDLRGTSILRILPKPNNSTDWISDRIRFSYDGLYRQRLLSPFINYNGSFVCSSWSHTLLTIRFVFNRALAFLIKFKKSSVTLAAIGGGPFSIEAAFSLKHLFSKLGASTTVYNEYCSFLPSSLSVFDFIHFHNISLRYATPSLNLLFRALATRGNTLFTSTSVSFRDYNYFVKDISSYSQLIRAKNPLSSRFQFASFPAFFSNASFSLLYYTNIYKGNVFSLFSYNPAISFYSTFYVNTMFSLPLPNRSETFHANYFLNSDYVSQSYLHSALTCSFYQGHHVNTTFTQSIDFIFPTSTSFESNSLFLSAFGDISFSNKVLNPAYFSPLLRSDWKVLKIFSIFLGVSLPWSSLSSLRLSLFSDLPLTNKLVLFLFWPFDYNRIKSAGSDFFFTNAYAGSAIPNNSRVMALCRVFSKYNFNTFI